MRQNRKVSYDEFYESVYEDYCDTILTVQEIARKYDISHRTVYNIKAYMEKKRQKEENSDANSDFKVNNKERNLRPPNNPTRRIEGKYIIQPIICVDNNTRRILDTQPNFQMSPDYQPKYVKQPQQSNRYVKQKQDAVTELCERQWELYNANYNQNVYTPQQSQFVEQDIEFPIYKQPAKPTQSYIPARQPTIPQKKTTQKKQKYDDDTVSIKSTRSKESRINIQTKKLPKKEPETEPDRKEKRKRIGQDALAFLENHRKMVEEREFGES